MNMNGMNMDFQQMQSPQNGGMYDASFIDPSAIANPQMNGARSYPMSSVPQKRDSTGAALSRSQTPSQQPPFGFQPGFSHTPSPTMQNQHFRQGSMVPQRLQSPAQNPQAQQMPGMGFNPGAPMGQGFDPSNGAQFAGVQLSQNLQQRQQEAQRRFMLQQQQQQQTQQMQQQQRQQQQLQQQQMAHMGNAGAPQGMGGQMPGMGMQQPGMQRTMVPGQPSPAVIQQQREMQVNFIRNVAALHNNHKRPFNPQPVVAGRPVNLQHLYRIVASSFKGSQVVNQTGQWPKVAQMLGFDLRAFPSAPDDLRVVYEQNLALYEEQYWKSRQAQQAHQAALQTRQNSMQQQQPMGMPSQMSPPRPSMPGAPSPSVNQEYIQSLQRSNLAAQQKQEQLRQAQAQAPFSPAVKQQQQFEHSTPVQSNATLTGVNGRSTPQTDAQAVGGTLDPQHRKSMSRQLESTPVPTPPGAQAATPAQVVERELPTNMVEGKVVYRPSWRVIDRWSGLDFEAERLKKRVDELVHYQPNLPSLQEMGVIDIRALTMSIRSGLHAETRLALDVLVKLTYELPTSLELSKSEDLIDVLVEFGEEQLEILANENPEISDIIDLTPYEDVIHNCNTEIYSLQQHAEFGSKEFDLDRTADRILALTTILRNLSFHEVNHIQLTTPPVLKFLANAIRLVGTRVLLLRTHMRTFDFMKDVVTLFSNTSTKISLPSRDDAYAILHFLCAFAPTPRPSAPVKFTAYNPRLHKCLPSAVDSLAKLLARDDPNRTYCKQIFASEASSTPPYDLLTRAFGLAIAVVPDRTSGLLHQVIETDVARSRQIETRLAEIRKPYLMQGMLAADILALLAPGPETGLCQSWLESEDGWANCLIKFVMNLCTVDGIREHQQQQAPQGRGARPVQGEKEEGYTLLVQRALSMMKKLGEKSRGIDVPVKGGPGSQNQVNGHASEMQNHRRRGQNGDMDLDSSSDDEDLPSDEEYEPNSRMRRLTVGGSVWRVRTNFLPWKETLLSAMLTPTLDERSLKQFCGIGYLDEAL